MKKYILPLLLLVFSAVSFGQSTSLPTVTFQNLDESKAWIGCGSCGNTGGTGALAVYSLQQESSASRDGVAAQFSIDGKGQPYANGLEHLTLGDFRDYTSFTYEYDILVPSQYASLIQGIEHDFQQDIAGYVFNGGLQFEMRTGAVRVYQLGKGWVPTNVKVPANWADGNWHHLKETFKRNGVGATGTWTDSTLTLDGVVYQLACPVNGVPAPCTFASQLRYSSTSYGLNPGLQLDTTKAGGSFYVLYDKVTVTVAQ